MAVIPLTKPYVMNDATFVVAADNYEAALSQVQLDPTVQTSTWSAINGDKRRGQARAEWSVTLGLAQDLDPDGFLRYLHDHEGEVVDAVLVPIAAGGVSVEVSLWIAPASIGGTAGADLAQSTVTLAVEGRPEFVDAP